MTMPTPEDLGRAPLWENYVIAQATQASLGLIPRNALALGVSVENVEVTIRCQLQTVNPDDEDDLHEIVEELAILVGGDVQVNSSYEQREAPAIAPDDGVSWIYVARQQEAST